MNSRLLPRLPRLARPLPGAAQARVHTTPPRRAPRVVPHVGSCPEPSCACEPPPPGLEIDRESRLRGVFVPYKEQVLVCSGRADWASKVEEEEGVVGDVVRALKGMFGKGGQFRDVSFFSPSLLLSSGVRVPGACILGGARGARLAACVLVWSLGANKSPALPQRLHPHSLFPVPRPRPSGLPPPLLQVLPLPIARRQVRHLLHKSAPPPPETPPDA